MANMNEETLATLIGVVVVIGVCTFAFPFLLWIQFKDVQDIFNLLRKIFVKTMDFIGQFLQFIGVIGGLLRQETSSADASIKIDVGDQCFLNLTLGDVTNITKNLQSLAEEETEMCSEWRHVSEEVRTHLIQHEAWCRSNFNYVILCPFLSDNGPEKRFQISTQEAWCKFVSSIIYVGRGTRSSRPYEHIYKAADLFQENVNNGLQNRNYRNYRNIDDKSQLIMDMWARGRGPIIVRFSHDVCRVEAGTREAIIIEALNVHKLKQVKKEVPKGTCAQWTLDRRMRLGTFLLWKAFVIWMEEGNKEVHFEDLIHTRPRQAPAV